MTNMERSHLRLTGATQVPLSSPERGYVGSNTISIALPVTTTAVHKDTNPADGLLI